jgi:hypothetical protein
MKIQVVNDAASLAGEQDLLERLTRLHERNDRLGIALIGVKNDVGDLRMRIKVHTDSELDAVCDLLENRELMDELNPVVEERYEGTCVQKFIFHVSHPEFECLYAS